MSVPPAVAGGLRVTLVRSACVSGRIHPLTQVVLTGPIHPLTQVVLTARTELAL